MINRLYLEIEPALAEDDRYKSSARWIARWLLELVQRRLQLSANKVCVTLEGLLKERDSLVEYLESSVTQPTSIEFSNDDN